MKAEIKIYAELEKRTDIQVNPSLIYQKKKEFSGEELIKIYCVAIMNKLQDIYEEKIKMFAEVTIEPLTINL